MPSANATPMGTAISVVYADSLSVSNIALCSAGLCQIELTLSPQYHRHVRPWYVACDLPLLNENRTASAIGASDQIRYSQVKPSRNHGCRHGLRKNRGADDLVPALVVTVSETAVLVMTPPVRPGWSVPRSRSSAPAG